MVFHLTETIKATIEVNENQKYKMFRKAKNRFGSLRGMKVAETPTKKEIDPFVQELIDKISEAAKENGFHPVEDNKEEPKKRMSVRSKIKGLSKITECMPRKSKTEKSKGERE